MKLSIIIPVRNEKFLIKKIVDQLQSKLKILPYEIIFIDDFSADNTTKVIKELIKFEPKKINTAVLVNRDHTLFPIKINFIGLSLSTSIKSHIEVKLNDNRVGAYLT